MYLCTDARGKPPNGKTIQGSLLSRSFPPREASTEFSLDTRFSRGLCKSSDTRLTARETFNLQPVL